MIPVAAVAVPVTMAVRPVVDSVVAVAATLAVGHGAAVVPDLVHMVSAMPASGDGPSRASAVIDQAAWTVAAMAAGSRGAMMVAGIAAVPTILTSTAADSAARLVSGAVAGSVAVMKGGWPNAAPDGADRADWQAVRCSQGPVPGSLPTISGAHRAGGAPATAGTVTTGFGTTPRWGVGRPSCS